MKSSSEISAVGVAEEDEEAVSGTHSSDFGERTVDTSLTSRNMAENSSFFLRRSSPLVSFSLSRSCTLCSRVP